MAQTFTHSGNTHAHSPSVFTTQESALITRALGLIEEKCLKSKPVLNNRQAFDNYLCLRFAGLTNEQGHTLYLNVNHELLSADAEFFGNQKSVAWDIRRTAARAIQLGAEYVVLAHNHPNGNPNPSEADFAHLGWFERTMKPLGITVLDSYVVSHITTTSIKTVRELRNMAYARNELARMEQQRAERRAKNMATRAANHAKKLAVEGVAHV